MVLMTGKEYIESLRKLKTEVYAFGERIENVADNPLTRPHVNAAAMTYELAHDPELEALFTATSHLTGEKINRFTHVHQNPEDLINKTKMLRAIGRITGTCFQRCVGCDALNALYSVTFEIDKKHGTNYHSRFKEFLTYVQRNDLMLNGAMTDPKGNRSLPPIKQADPDLYLRVVEEKADGIVVRGAKAHQTGAVNSHEVVAIPTAVMDEENKDYAISFSVPVDTEGILFIFGRQSNDGRKLEEGSIDRGNANYGVVGGEALLVFEDVFVPLERVFMFKEYEFSSLLVERFASHHRQNYGACKAGVSDAIVGATTLMAEYNNVSKTSHIRDKITEMVHLTETLYSGSIACSAEGSGTPSGAYTVNSLLANTVKHNATRFIYEICRLSQDIAGGLIATLPSEQDLKDPEVGKYVEKYFRGIVDVPTEHRIRMVRLIENMTGGTALIESMHGAGSPQTQRIMILRQADLEEKKKTAKVLAGIDEDRYLKRIRG